ncbi:hypothetical protein P154DRAFT_202829 [Amniculicola lignicola CBS 123094]|uniref:Peptidase S54 rhomboid domain-containing protein n=1 Tax=Amniculicola lignicola CBS 123094 TaxID=1392246 RepID=A0A6A5WEZ7_9PLEO|nr:hypothetical protein P154DRAFT_202829 [Amniculicola lignicola CBS 123094]
MALLLRTVRLLRPHMSLEPSHPPKIPTHFFRPSPLGSRTPLHIRFRSRLSRPKPNEPFSNNKGNNMLIIQGMIGINTAVFLYGQYAEIQLKQGITKSMRWFRSNFFLNYNNFWYEQRYWTAITSNFTHLGFFHIFGNCISFYFMSRLLAMTPKFMPRNLLTLIIGSGLSGSFFTLFRYGNDPQRAQKSSVGFSGAVSGVAATAACMYPHTTFQLYGIIPMPLWVLVGGYFIYDGFYLNSRTSKISHEGHLGGGAFGLLYYLYKMRTGRWF